MSRPTRRPICACWPAQGCCDGTGWRLYKNGTQVAFAAGAGEGAAVLTSTDWAIGGRGGNNDPLTADLKKVFSGEVIVGADQMRI